MDSDVKERAWLGLDLDLPLSPEVEKALKGMVWRGESLRAARDRGYVLREDQTDTLEIGQIADQLLKYHGCFERYT